VAEEARARHLGRDLAGARHHEGSVGAVGVRLDVAGHHLLARALLAGDQHRLRPLAVRGRDEELVEVAAQALGVERVPDELGAVLRRRHLLQQVLQALLAGARLEVVAERVGDGAGVGVHPLDVGLEVRLARHRVLEVEDRDDRLVARVQHRRAQHREVLVRVRERGREVRVGQQARVLHDVGLAGLDDTLDRGGADAGRREPLLERVHLVEVQLPLDLERAELERLPSLDEQEQRLAGADAPDRGLEAVAERLFLGTPAGERTQGFAQRQTEKRVVAPRCDLVHQATPAREQPIASVNHGYGSCKQALSASSHVIALRPCRSNLAALSAAFNQTRHYKQMTYEFVSPWHRECLVGRQLRSERRTGQIHRKVEKGESESCGSRVGG